jgi:CBS domain-containing protein
MSIVADILRTKAERSVHSIGPAASAFEAAQAMARKNVGALVVVDGGRIVGIVTERDYARKLVPMDRMPRDTPVRDIMSSPVMYVRTQHTSDECMALMTENRLRHLPVVDQGQLVGLVSIGDLVKDIISDQQFVIEQLEHYISGQR